MTTPEKQENIDDLSKKQQNIQGFDTLSFEAKYGFQKLAPELDDKKDGKYTETEIKASVSKSINTQISKSINLNVDEKERLEQAKVELLKGMDGKGVKGALEQYSLLHDKIEGIISAGSGKSQMNDKNLKQAQEGAKENADKSNDAFRKLQEIIQGAISREQANAKKAKDSAKAQGDKSCGVTNPEVAAKAQGECNDSLALA